MTPNEALKHLRQGNDRYVHQRGEHPRSDAWRRLELLDGQDPFALVVACADARIVPDVIFDQGLGDLFVVRVAGNLLETAALGSALYAIEVLQVPLTVVLGHDDCGAIKTALKPDEYIEALPPSLSSLLHSVRRAMPRAMQRHDSGDEALSLGVDEVAQTVARSLCENALTSQRIATGTHKVVAARYELDSGRVHWLDEEKE